MSEGRDLIKASHLPDRVSRDGERKGKKERPQMEHEYLERLLDKIDYGRIHEILTKHLKKAGVQPPYNLLGRQAIKIPRIMLVETSALYDHERNAIEIDGHIFGDHIEEFGPDEDYQLKVLHHIVVHEMIHAASPNRFFQEQHGGEKVNVFESGLSWSMHFLGSRGIVHGHDLINEAITEHLSTEVLNEYYGYETGTERAWIHADERRPEVEAMVRQNDHSDFFEYLTERLAAEHGFELDHLRRAFIAHYLRPDGSLHRPDTKKALDELITPEVRKSMKNAPEAPSPDDPEDYEDIEVRVRWAALKRLIDMEIVSRWD